MSDPLKNRSDAFSEHLESLYLFAQAVTLDGAAAARLVEATYQRAYATPVEERPLVDEKTWLYGLMMQIHQEQRDAADLLMQDPPAPSSFRQHLAEQLLDRKLPAALTALPETDRLLLLLCETERLSCLEAGRVLGLNADAACARLEAARASLEHALRASAPDVERTLLHTSLPEDWMRPGLKRFLQSEFTPLPPPLRHAVAAAAKQQQRAARLPLPRTQATRRLPGAPEGLSLRRVLVALLLIATAGLLGYAVSELSEQEPDRNLITLSARQARAAKPLFRTDNPAQAERFILDQLGWRLTLPTIEGASLTGVGINELASGIQTPVFLYEEAASGQPITLFTYSYAFLDRHRDRVTLDADVLNQIQEEQHFDLYDFDEDKVLVWRNRDDIYVAVTQGNAESLSERILFPS